MSGSLRATFVATAATALIVLSPLATPVRAQTGGFLESATSTAHREPLSAGELQELLPTRGRFTFPSPYSTIAARITNAADCGGSDCVNYVGYSYWSNINNHVGSETMLIFLGLDRNRGGVGPSLFSYNKTTGDTRSLGPLFESTNPLSWATGEGWYFSATRESALYLNDGPRMVRYDVVTRESETVFDVRYVVWKKDVYIWQMHSSADDQVHSATVKNSTTFQPLGCVTYREDTGQSNFFPAIGDFDECQIDKSGRWLLIKDNLDHRNGEDNRIIDLQTGLEQWFFDEDGAAGHSDVGFGYMVAEDDYASHPGAARVWKFNDNFYADGQGTLVYYLTSWSSGLGHLAHGNARPDVPLKQQTVCSSNATRLALPRVNEIVCYRLDDSLQVLVVAPNMTDLDAAGGGGDDYSKLPKGNRDVTGEYFMWTSNTGSDRLDAFIVHVPQSKLTAPVVTPTPVTWASAVNLSTANNGLQKISGCDGCPDATAVSNQIISSVGWAQWSAPEVQTLRVLGLSPNTVVTGAPDIPFAIRLQAGTAEVRELGTYKAETPFVVGDTFRITVEHGTVGYQKNGTTFYVSATTATEAMRIHAILYGLDGALSDIVAGLAPPSGGGPTDTTPPAVFIDSPSGGAVVSDSVVVSAGATDNAGVAKVEFYLDDVVQTTDPTSPYQWAWNTATVSDGSHVLQAKAYDAAGNVGVSATSSVTVRHAATNITTLTATDKK